MSLADKFFGALEAVAPKVESPVALATVDPGYVPGKSARVTFDGETTLTTKAYLTTVELKPLSRVLMQRIGPTWVITGVVGFEDTGISQGLWATSRRTLQIFNNSNSPQNHAEMCVYQGDLNVGPAKTVSVTTPNLDFTGAGSYVVGGLPNDTSVEMLGYFGPAETGTYEFAVDGDDAVEFFLFGRLISAIYGSHGVDGLYAQRKTLASLTAGRLFPICIRQHNGGGGSSIQVWYRTPSMIAASAPMALVPDEAWVKPPIHQLPTMRQHATRRTWNVLGTNTFWSPAAGGTAVGLGNGWGIYNSLSDPFSAAGFSRTLEGVVMMQGLIAPPAGGGAQVAAFTLPEGYRPAKNKIMACTCSTGPYELRIGTDGVVVPFAGTAGGWNSIACSFVADS